jgi:hypothetical protein
MLHRPAVLLYTILTYLPDFSTRHSTAWISVLTGDAQTLFMESKSPIELSISVKISRIKAGRNSMDDREINCACSGAGAILRSLQEEQGLAAKSLLVSFEKPDALCQLDASTALALRVISDRGDGVKKWSLYSTIEPHLKLKAGRRLLRASLLQPLISQPTILERQNAIADLISMPDVQAGLQNFLQSIPPGVHQCLPVLSHVVPVPTTTHSLGGNPNDRLKAPTRLIQAVLKLKALLVEMQVSASCILLPSLCSLLLPQWD